MVVSLKKSDFQRLYMTDPKIISDEEILKWGEETMRNGVINDRQITGYSSNGLK